MAAKPASADSTTAARVQSLVDEVLADTPHYVVDLEVRGATGSQVVNLYVDSDEGIGVDDLAELSRSIGFLLDTEEVFPARYTLNVSTPGVDRPLKLRRQYQKNIGRRLQVHYEKAPGDNTEVTGELIATDDETITVKPEDAPTRTIAFDAILWAKVRLPW